MSYAILLSMTCAGLKDYGKNWCEGVDAVRWYAIMSA